VDRKTVQISAGAIIRQGSRVLIVKPTYREYWLLPGGHVEAGESPREALRREIEEELGLAAQIGALLSIDYWRKGAVATRPGCTYVQPHDALVLLFDGGELILKLEQQIRLRREELEDVKVVEIEDAIQLLAPYYEGRVRSALKSLEAGRVIYLESGGAAEQTAVLKANQDPHERIYDGNG
jgi:8-oxo-dGTP pyrophosphatase MutT (NUDIX family)